MAGNVRLVLVGVLAAAAAGVAWYRSQVYSKPAAIARPNLVVVTGGSGPYWQLLSQGVRAAANDVGADVKLFEPARDEDLQEQTKMLAEIVPTEVDGVALSPLDAAQQTRLINSLAEKTMVISVDSDAPLSNRLCYIGASNFAAGKQCGKLVQEAATDGGEVAVLMANLTKYNMLERQQGLEEQLASPAEEDSENVDSAEDDSKQAPTYEIVAVLVDEGDQDRCLKQLTEVLDEHSDLACVVGLNAYHGGVMVEALKQKEMLGKVKVVAFDTEEETLDAIDAGHIYATVAQDPYQYGYEAVRRLVYNCQRTGNQLPLIGVQSTVTISTKTLRDADIEDFRKLYNERLAASDKAAAE